MPTDFASNLSIWHTIIDSWHRVPVPCYLYTRASHLHYIVLYFIHRFREVFNTEILPPFVPLGKKKEKKKYFLLRRPAVAKLFESMLHTWQEILPPYAQ